MSISGVEGRYVSAGVMCRTALLRSCTLKAMASFIDSVYLVFRLPLSLLASTFPYIIVFLSESWEGKVVVHGFCALPGGCTPIQVARSKHMHCYCVTSKWDCQILGASTCFNKCAWFSGSQGEKADLRVNDLKACLPASILSQWPIVKGVLDCAHAIFASPKRQDQEKWIGKEADGCIPI